MSELISRVARAHPFDLNAFKAPPACFYPVFAWIWNDEITREGIRERLDQMQAAGIRGVYILAQAQSFRPATMRTYLSPDYLTDQYLALAREACAYARSLGMQVWLYDESGWPSGCAGGRVVRQNPALCRKEIARDESGAIVRRENPSVRLVDSLDAETGRAFVRETHERYARAFGELLGSDIPLIFTDEPGAGARPWPRGLEKRFRARYGYELSPFLPAIFNEALAVTREAQTARADYGILLGEIFRDSYLKPIRAWCAKHGMASGGHLDLDNETDGCLRQGYGSVLPLLREMDVPGVDVIWRQIFPPKAPGESACANEFRFFPRMASSAAAQAGGRLALSESFGVYGAGVTGETMRYVVNYQLARGINLFNFMDISYGKQRGLPLVEQPCFVSEIPGYAHLPAVCAFAARASWLMSLGDPAADTALYFPARDLWAGGAAGARAKAEFERLGNALEAEGVDFDIIDDEGAENAAIEGGRLCLGIARYAHAVVPEGLLFMPEGARKKLSAFPGRGTPPICAENPHFRMRARLLSGGKLVFLFNEAACAQTARVRFSGPARACLLRPENAGVSAFENGAALSLPGGGAAVLFLMEAQAACPDLWAPAALPPAADARPAGLVRGFTLTKTRETRMEPSGLRVYAYPPAPFRADLGDWAPYFGIGFSGEAVYRAQVELYAPPEEGMEYWIDLGRADFSARVRVNGREIGLLSMTPMRLPIPPRALSQTFSLEIEVANTLANQLTLKSIADYYPACEMGAYYQKSNAYLRDSLSGGLYGPVRVLARPRSA